MMPTFQLGQLGRASFQAAAASDPHFSSVVLLLNMLGTSLSTTVSDSSASAHTMTCRGGGNIITTDSPFTLGQSCFDTVVGGNGSAVDCAGNSDFVFGTGDFTVEGWLKTSDASGGFIDFFTSGQASWEIFIESGGKIRWYRNVTLVLDSVTTYNDSAWHHVAVSRTGSTIYLFVDGVQKASTTDSNNYSYTSSFLSVGRQFSGSPGATSDLSCHAGPIRITKGVGRYTTGFTPPTAPFPTH